MPRRTHLCLIGLCLLALCCAFSAISANAQSQAGTGTIVGTVYDSSGAVVPKAKVTAQGKGTGLTREVQANDEGQYRIILLPPGAYTVTVSQSGFKTYKGEVEVNVGATPTLDIHLAVGAATETIEVTASVVVETTTSVADALINEKAIDNLPINGRRFHDFVSLTPTVQIEGQRNQISFAGQRGINSNVTIDGADYNQPFFGGIRGGERSNNAFTIPQESIQEFQVVANGFSAEFGRSTGGVVNAVTKSGTNDWHGSAFYQGRYEQLAHIDAFNRKAVDNQHQFGGSFGGPIAKEKLFFFFSPEFQKIDIPRAVVLANLNNLLTTSGFVLNAFNQRGFDFYDSLQEDFTTTNNAKTILGKVDYQINNNNRAFLRYHWSSNTGENAVATGDGVTTTTTNTVSNDGTEKDRTHTVSGQWTGLFSSSFVNELRAQWAREERPREANVRATSIAIGIGTYGTRSFLPTTESDDRVQIADSLNWTKGTHSLKFGGDFNWLRAGQFFKFDQFGVFTGVTVPNISGAGGVNCTANSAASPGGSNGYLLRVLTPGQDPSVDPRCDPANVFDTDVSYRVNIGNGDQQMRGHELAFFVHDTWRVHPRFTVNAGLRWEGYFNPKPDVSNTTLYNLVKNFPFPNGKTFDPAIFPNQTDQWAPRLGIAWDPRGNAKMVIRMNAGLYYARNPLLLFATPLNNFRNPPGDIRTTIPFRDPAGNLFTACPAGVTPLAAGDNCRTIYWQLRRIGIDLNTIPLTSMPALTPTDLINIATALGITNFNPNLIPGTAPTVLSNNYESPRAFQWSVGFDREIARGWSVGADYLYVNTVHLQRNTDYNLPAPTVCPDVNSSATVVTPDAQLRPMFHLTNSAGSACSNGTGFANPSFSRPIPNLGAIGVRETNARALYRALTLRSVIRRSKWQLQTYYTLSKNLSDDDNERDAGGQAAVNAFNFLEEYSYARLDVRHLLLVNGLYDLPWGFQVSALGRFRSGRPFEALAGSNFDANEDTISNDRPFAAPGVPFARNAFRDRPVYNFDMRVTKRIKITEKTRVDVFADFFNLFNFDNVVFATATNTNFTTSIYGQGIDRTTGATLAPDARFQRLKDPANCSPTTATGAVNTNFNKSCYDRSNISGLPFQMQIGVRFTF